MPYAFNYHFDQGVFRGLAFANFRSGEEADAVVAALNGFDVSGRKLRVEYKKVLQAGEKERIEKEKAIKRMQSMQMEKERERVRRHQLDGSDYGQPPMPGQQHDPLMMQSYGNDPSIFSTSTIDPPATSHAPLTADTLRVVDQQNGVDLGTTSDRSAAGASSKKEGKCAVGQLAKNQCAHEVCLQSLISTTPQRWKSTRGCSSLRMTGCETSFRSPSPSRRWREGRSTWLLRSSACTTTAWEKAMSDMSL